MLDKFRYRIIPAVPYEKMTMIWTKVHAVNYDTKLCCLLLKSLLAQVSHFLWKKYCSPEVGSKLQMIIALPNAVSVPSQSTTLNFFNLSCANHIDTSSGGIVTYLPEGQRRR